MPGGSLPPDGTARGPLDARSAPRRPKPPPACVDGRTTASNTGCACLRIHHLGLPRDDDPLAPSSAHDDRYGQSPCGAPYPSAMPACQRAAPKRKRAQLPRKMISSRIVMQGRPYSLGGRSLPRARRDYPTRPFPVKGMSTRARISARPALCRLRSARLPGPRQAIRSALGTPSLYHHSHTMSSGVRGLPGGVRTRRGMMGPRGGKGMILATRDYVKSHRHAVFSLSGWRPPAAWGPRSSPSSPAGRGG